MAGRLISGRRGRRGGAAVRVLCVGRASATARAEGGLADLETADLVGAGFSSAEKVACAELGRSGRFCNALFFAAMASRIEGRTAVSGLVLELATLDTDADIEALLGLLASFSTAMRILSSRLARNLDGKPRQNIRGCLPSTVVRPYLRIHPVRAPCHLTHPRCGVFQASLQALLDQFDAAGVLKMRLVRGVLLHEYLEPIGGE